MAEISAGIVNVDGGRYEVILRRVGGNNANRAVNPVANAEGAQNMNINVEGMMGGKKKQKQNGGKSRKLSPYMKFAQKVRPEIIKNDPSLKSDIPGIGRKIGEMWRALSAEEKAKY
jgi:hypothetical protein